MENTKIFVVTGQGGRYEDHFEDKLYVGFDTEYAFNFEPDSKYSSIVIEMWIAGVKIKSWVSNDNDNQKFEIDFDKIDELEKRTKKLKKELEESESQLQQFREIIKR